MSAKYIFINAKDFDMKSPDTGERIKGTSVKFLRRGVDSYDCPVVIAKVSIPDEKVDFRNKVKSIIPGSYIEFDFNFIPGRKKPILVDIIPGDVAVDFDKIL